jgi:hypothetical protein
MATTLGAAFIAKDNSNRILVCTSTDGLHWTSNVPVTGQSSKTSPSMAVFNFDFWLAFIANDASNRILVCSSTDGVNWTNNTSVAGQSSGSPPSLVVFNRGLWLAFIANDPSNRILVCSSPDGVHWTNNTQVAGQSSKAAPSLAVFNKKLWLAFIANDPSNRILVCSSVDGRNWSINTPVPGQSSKAAPSLVVFNNKLWVAFIANDNSNKILICSSPDGTDWSNNVWMGQTSGGTPSLTVLNGELRLAFIANDPSERILVCSSSDGLQWSNNSQMGQESSKYFPSLTAAVVFTGQVHPLYEVLTVVYAPPGTKGGNSKSLVDYGSGSGTGTTTSTSKSFKAGVDVSVKITAPIVSETSDFTFSDSKTDTSSIDIKKNQSFDLKVGGPGADGINHDEDQFVLWLNPMLNVSIDPLGNVQWEPAIDGTMLIQYVSVAELKNPASMRPGVKQALDAAGLTPTDYIQILKTNPFATANAAIDPERFLLCSQSFPYEPPLTASDPVDLTTYNQNNSVTNANTQATQVQYGVSVKVEASIAKIFSTAVTGSMQWTNTSTIVKTNSSSQSATVTVAGPSFGYPGPTNVLVYWDTVYSSFMFAFATEPPTAAGTLTDNLGKPVAKKLVTLSAGPSLLSTFTDASGSFRFYGAPSGQGKVSVDDQEFAVAVGPATPKAALRLAPQKIAANKIL